MASVPDTAARQTTARRKPPAAKLVSLILGQTAKMRFETSMTLIAVVLYVSWTAMYQYAVPAGLMSRHHAQILTAINSVGLCFYPLIRSGLTRRFHDSALLMPQIIVASSATMLDFVFIPAWRPAALLLLAIAVMYSFLALKPRETVMVGFGIAGVLLLITIGLWLERAGTFEPQRDVPNIAVACIGLVGLSLVARKHSELRLKVRSQKRELTQTLARVETLATRDSLTGLMNRQTMEARLAEEVKSHARDNHSFTLVLVDLDYFKRINDTHGHHVGDEVLCIFAAAVPTALRQSDTVARWGGEEFLILFPKARPQQILEALERLRGHLAATRPLESISDLSITFSAGIAENAPGAEIERTLERADKALYEAKKAGRNRCVIASTAAEQA